MFLSSFRSKLELHVDLNVWLNTISSWGGCLWLMLHKCMSIPCKWIPLQDFLYFSWSFLLSTVIFFPHSSSCYAFFLLFLSGLRKSWATRLALLGTTSATPVPFRGLWGGLPVSLAQKKEEKKTPHTHIYINRVIFPWLVLCGERFTCISKALNTQS